MFFHLGTQYRSQRGFTLIELLIVITVMSAFVMLPAFQITLTRTPISIAKLRASADTYDDVAVLEQNGITTTLGVRQLGATGEVSQVYYPAPANGKKVIAVDLNNDGFDDVVTLHGNGTLKVFRNNGSGVFTSTTTATGVASPTDIASGDLDNDGRQDLAVASGNSVNGFTLSVLYNINGVGLSAPQVVPVGQVAGIIAGNDTPISSAVLSQKLSSPLATPKKMARAEKSSDSSTSRDVTESTNLTFFTTGVRALTIGDVTGSGLPEIIVATVDSGISALRVLQNTPTGFVTLPAYVLAHGGDASSIAAGDFNRDGELDIAITNYDDNSISIFRNNSRNGFLADQVFPTGAGPVGVAVKDTDLDLRPDIIVATESGTILGGQMPSITFLQNSTPTIGGNLSFIRSEVATVDSVSAIITGNFSPQGTLVDFIGMKPYTSTLSGWYIWQ